MKNIDDFKFISTAKGDKGTSKNYSNKVFSKSDILFETLGNIDELSSVLGIVYHHTAEKEEIKTIQKILQNISSLVATTDTLVREEKLIKVEELNVFQLEILEQSLLKKSNIEPKFVLPGSDTSLVGSYYDLARSVSRRAERSLVRFIEYYKRTDLDCCLKYLNRLSDLLFIYARSLAEN